MPRKKESEYEAWARMRRRPRVTQAAGQAKRNRRRMENLAGSEMAAWMSVGSYNTSGRGSGRTTSRSRRRVR